MMETADWVVTELKELLTDSQDYKEKALFLRGIELIKEQEHRQSQMAGELDGTLWSPNNW